MSYTIEITERDRETKYTRTRLSRLSTTSKNSASDAGARRTSRADSPASGNAGGWWRFDDLKKAFQRFEAAPDEPEAFFHLGTALLMAGQEEEAFDRFSLFRKRCVETHGSRVAAVKHYEARFQVEVETTQLVGILKLLREVKLQRPADKPRPRRRQSTGTCVVQ